MYFIVIKTSEKGKKGPPVQSSQIVASIAIHVSWSLKSEFVPNQYLLINGLATVVLHVLLLLLF